MKQTTKTNKRNASCFNYMKSIEAGIKKNHSEDSSTLTAVSLYPDMEEVQVKPRTATDRIVQKMLTPHACFWLSLLVFSFICHNHLIAQNTLWGVTLRGGQSGNGVIFKTDSSGNNQSVVYSFLSDNDASNPEYTHLIQATDGMLYGMTESGGANFMGVLFQYNPLTSAYTKKFDFASASGAFPSGSLVQASDGNLYGMTSSGGVNNLGVLFQYNPLTSTYTKIFDFDGLVNGRSPVGSLMQASDGNLYGMTYSGGANNVGVLFQYNPFTSVYTKKFDFDGSVNGSSPYGSLIQALDSNLYGMTSSGGANNFGVLFQYNLSNSTLTNKFDFDGTANGSNPYGSLMQASDSNLYGMTRLGGPNNAGVLFQYNTGTSTFAKKHDFATATGRRPYGSLIQATDGKLYGLTTRGGAEDDGVIFQYDPGTSVYTKKFDFEENASGSFPSGSLMQASDGNLYGMTYEGGNPDEEGGVFFQYNPLTSVYTKKFDFIGLSNGGAPVGNLIQATDGKLYGMTREGGLNNYGVLYQFNPFTSTFIKKLDFDGTTYGAGPDGSLLLASDGNLYGTTTEGGVNNDGVLFRYNPITSTYTKLLDFDNITYGDGPIGSLMQASDGNLYGMASGKGANWNGILFRYNPMTFTFTVMFDFDFTNGSYPRSLMQASDGNLYGITEHGGANYYGVLFQFNPGTSTFTKKFDFDGLNGAQSRCLLVQGSDGDLYGVATAGGANGNGALFKYDPDSSVYTKLVDFESSTTGAYPQGSLMKASDGNFYGMTSSGGAYGRGVLFQYNPNTSTLSKTLDFTYSNGANPHDDLTEIPPCFAPTITCPGNQAAITAGSGCNAMLTYTVSTSGTAPVALHYSFSGVTPGSGNGDGSGSTFNKGTTTVTLIASNFCGADTCSFDVVVTEPSGMSTISICDTWTWIENNNTVYNSSGIYTNTFTTNDGCDSIHTLNLTIYYSSSSNSNQTICSHELPFEWNGLTFTGAGTQTAVLNNAVECDSVATLNLSVTPTNYSTDSVKECLSYTWRGETYTVSGTYWDTIGCDIAELRLTITNEIILQAKAFLQGAFDPNTGLMHDSMRSKGVISLSEPYSSAPFNKPALLEDNGETLNPTILSTTGPNAIVDWVYLELRDATVPTIIVSARRALIQRDGDIVSHEDGVSPVRFFKTPPGNYYVGLKHRNHLGVMSAGYLTFAYCTPAVINFTNPATPVYVNTSITVNPPRNTTGSVSLLWAGDANNNKNTKFNGISNDKTVVLNSIGGVSMINNVLDNVYRVEDCNLNGKVTYNGADNDRQVILSTVGVSTPNNVFNQHTLN